MIIIDILGESEEVSYSFSEKERTPIKSYDLLELQLVETSHVDETKNHWFLYQENTLLP